MKSDYLVLLYTYNNLLDGGQTSVLLDKLEDTWTIDQWNLRNELLTESPYLSIGVLIELVRSEKLPLTMCAEILLSNPDATKKDALISFMDEETNYLTPLVKQLIEDSWNTRTFRTTMESSIAEQASEIEFTHRAIIDCILNDTTGISLTNYRNVLSNMNNASAMFELVDSYIGTKNYSNAVNILQNMQAASDADSLEIEDYLTYVSIFANADSTTDLDDALLPLSENYTKAGRKAKSLLQFKGIVYDYHPYIVPDEEPEPKAARVKGSFADLMSDNIQVQPNPAKTYVSIIYNLDPQGTYTFKITDNMGKTLIVEKLKGSEGMQSVDIRTLSNDSYVYSVESEQGIIKSDKIIIIK